MVRRYCSQGRIQNAQQNEHGWLIPENCKKPQDGRAQKLEQVMVPSLVRRVLYQRIRNNHFGIYEYIQIELA